MGNSYTGPDRFYYPIRVTTKNNRFVFKEESKTVVDDLILDIGLYWMHRDSQIDSEYPSFYLAIENLLNTNGTLAGTYQFQIHTPSGGLTNSSVSLVQTDDPNNDSITLKFNDGDWTMNRGWFGFPVNESSEPNGADRIDGTASILGAWQSPKTAAYKTRNRSSDVIRSNPGPNAVSNKWIPDTETRMFRYHEVATGHIYKYRAQDSTLATEAGLPTGDTNNAFEHLLSGMQISDTINIYNEGDSGNALVPTDGTFDGLVEACSVDQSTQKGLTDIITGEQQYGGQYYDLNWEMLIERDNVGFSGYDH